MTRTVLLLALLALTPLLALAPAAADASLCEGPSQADIATFRSGTTTIQVAGNTFATNLTPTQAMVFSLDGGFWVDVEHRCVQLLVVRVFKNGALAQMSQTQHDCSTATHHEWVPMGLETAEVRVEVAWTGCDGVRGGARGNGAAGDPPVFTREGELRALV